MATKIFVNLPVRNLTKSIEFFTQLGFTFNPVFTNESATCMIIGENIFAMLLTEPAFKTFTKKEIADASKTTEVLIAIDAESRAQVDDMVAKAKKAGGHIYAEAADHGWMYQHSFADLDGHQWEIGFMDETAIPKEMQEKQHTVKTAVTVSTTIDAPVEKTWDYFTAPQHITNWCFASDDWQAPKATNDLQKGGKFTTRMEAKDGSMGFDFEGTYTEVKKYELIAYDIADGRHVKVSFGKSGDKSTVTETFEIENMNPADVQRGGWQAILDNFKHYTESH
jgi:uncharacterized protein